MDGGKARSNVSIKRKTHGTFAFLMERRTTCLCPTLRWCVCLCVYVYICMCVYVFTHVYILYGTRAFLMERITTCLYLTLRWHAHACMRVHVHLRHVSLHETTHANVYIYIYEYIYIHTCAGPCSIQAKESHKIVGQKRKIRRNTAVLVCRISCNCSFRWRWGV